MATKPSALPPLSALFKESWETFKGSVLNLFLLHLTAAGIFIGIFLVTLIVSLPLGIFSIVSAVSANKVTPAFFSSLGVVGIIFLIGLVAAIIVGYAVHAASIMFADGYTTKPAFGETFKKGFSYIWPLFLVALLTGLIAGGGYFLFIIPGIVLAIFFSFAPYEVVLNKQGVISSLRRSMRIVLSHFWGILGRMLLWIGIVIAVSVIPNILLGSKNAAAGLPFLSLIINALVGWFGICYSLTLYKQAAQGLEKDPGSNIVWPVIVGIVGWVVGAIILVSTISLVIALILQSAKNNPNKNAPNPYNMQNVMETVYPSMPYPSGTIRPTGMMQYRVR